MKYLTREKKANPDLPDVFPASEAPIPKVREDVETMEAINRFVKDNPIEKAEGGRIELGEGGGKAFRLKALQEAYNKYGKSKLDKGAKVLGFKNYAAMEGDANLNFRRKIKDQLTKYGEVLPKGFESDSRGRKKRVLKEQGIQIKLLEETNKKKFFDPKQFAKANNITLPYLKKQANRLQTNIYKKRMLEAGKDIGGTLEWIPQDPTFSDNALNKLWKSKLIKYEREKIDELFYDAFGREFKKGTRERNPSYNSKKFLAIKKNLNEYRQLRNAINAKYPNINFELDHPLSKSSLNKLFNATTEQLTRVNVLEADLNNGFKDSLSLQYEKAVQGNNLNKKKAVEKIAKDLKLNIGKISDDATNFKYGVQEFQKLNIKNEIGKSLENLQFLNKNFQDYTKKNPELFKTANINPNQTFTKIDNVKGLSAFMKGLGIKCRLANGVNCNMPQAYQKSVDELTQKAQQGDTAARAKLTNFTNKAATAGRFVKNALGPLAIASELAIEGGIALNKTLQTGVPLKTAFADSIFNLALGPKLQIDKEAELAKEFAKGEDFAMAERGRRMMIPQSATADAQRLKKREQQMEQAFPTTSPQEIDEILKARDMTIQDFGMTYPQIQDFIKQDQQTQAIADAGGVANLAGGGIAKMAGDPSGRPPESGPNSQGLLSLKNRVRNY
jgi:hypothetical protein